VTQILSVVEFYVHRILLYQHSSVQTFSKPRETYDHSSADYWTQRKYLHALGVRETRCAHW